MKQRTPIILAFFIILIHCSDPKNKEAIKDNGFKLEDGLYYESIANPTAYSYNLDNKIFTIGKEYIYNYWHIENKDTFKVKVLPVEGEREGFYHKERFDEAWDLVPPDKCDSIITQVSIAPYDHTTNSRITPNPMQSIIKLSYYSGNKELHFNEYTGVIENEMNIWIHPFRAKYFSILEINPFPFIQQPFEVDNTWHWNLSIGQHWGDRRWRTWEGNINNQYTYEITDRRSITTNLGELDVFVVEGVAQSTLGTSKLTSYYNIDYGFVRLEYVNINNTQTIFELVEVKEMPTE